MKNMRVKLIGALVALAVLGCAAAEKKAGSQEAAASKGAVRIISAAPSNTEIVIGLGLGDNLIAIDRHSQGLPGAPPNLPEIDFFYPDIEAVIGLAPDLILVNEINTYGVAENPFLMLEKLGMKVAPIRTSPTVESIYEDILYIAGELGVPERGEALVKTMREEIDRIVPTKSDPPPSVYFEVSPAPAMLTLGTGTYISDMIELAGGRNIFADQTGWFSPGAEEIIGRNPDIIFTFVYPGEDPVPEILSRPAFQNIKAVREKRVYAIDADSASRPSQNIIKAFRQMAAALHE